MIGIYSVAKKDKLTKYVQLETLALPGRYRGSRRSSLGIGHLHHKAQVPSHTRRQTVSRQKHPTRCRNTVTHPQNTYTMSRQDHHPLQRRHPTRQDHHNHPTVTRCPSRDKGKRHTRHTVGRVLQSFPMFGVRDFGYFTSTKPKNNVTVH